MLSSEIDLCKSPHLRLLQLDLNLGWIKSRKIQDDTIRWFSSICESVTSKSLVVEVWGPSREVEFCDKIQDTLLTLYAKIKPFSVYLVPGTKKQGLFSRLYETGIVVEENIRRNEDKQVSYCTLTSIYYTHHFRS